ncbi:hypothetical protein RISK_003066 [Rhodopirellula islandica]|uniref:Transmembrane protein n=1 Tax=Rhodopirellula islandica TaxID=595434 RepID=A0A0J1BDU9_RHOIS|nr:hypothetical protein RISK_003066 [Rhodopirellula islandica]
MKWTFNRHPFAGATMTSLIFVVQSTAILTSIILLAVGVTGYFK